MLTLNQSYGFTFNKIGQRMDEIFSSKLSRFHLVSREYGDMLTIWEHENISQKEVGNILEIDRTTMVKLIDGLESKKYIQRRKNISDRRYYVLVLTELGEHILKEMWSLMKISENEVINQLSEHEKSMLFKVNHLLNSKEMESMDQLTYLKERIESTISPMDYMKESKQNPDKFYLVDVRNAPAHLKKDKIAGAVEIPQIELEQRYTELPKDKTIVVYCWDVWCNLATKAGITLIEKGFKVKELSGGIAAWNILQMPTVKLVDTEGETPSCDC